MVKSISPKKTAAVFKGTPTPTVVAKPKKTKTTPAPVIPPMPPLISEILKEKLGQYQLTPAAFAVALRVHHGVVERALSGSTISADTACRLALAFGTSPEYWLNLQIQRQLWETQYHTVHNRIGIKFIGM